METWCFDNFTLLAVPKPCAVCDRPTCWAELNFQCYLHPGPCDVRMWQDYYEACRRSDELH